MLGCRAFVFYFASKTISELLCLLPSAVSEIGKGVTLGFYVSTVPTRLDGVLDLFSCVRLLRVTFLFVFVCFTLIAMFLLIGMCQADIVFWIGDLNYRIAENVSDAQVFEMLRKDDLETLRYDVIRRRVNPHCT